MDKIEIKNLKIYAYHGVFDEEKEVGQFFLVSAELFLDLRDQGATILFSSHILSEVQRNCTRAAVIREGQIVACDSVENLAKTNARRVTVYGNVDLSGMDGIRDLKSAGGSASFLYSGEMNALLRRLSEGNIEDLSITEPDLEEVFLHFYVKGGEQE